MFSRRVLSTWMLAVLFFCAIASVSQLLAGPCETGCKASDKWAYHTGTQAETVGWEYDEVVSTMSSFARNIDPQTGSPGTPVTDIGWRVHKNAAYYCSVNCTLTRATEFSGPVLQGWMDNPDPMSTTCSD